MQLNLSTPIATGPEPPSFPDMSSDEVIGLVVTVLVMLMGLMGAVLPVLPGPPIVLLAAVGHRLWFTDRSVPWWVILVLAVVTGLVSLLDFLASTYGARRLGATWRGMVGAVIGAVIGVFWIPPVGLLLGPLLGAALAELLGGRDLREAGKAGLGAALGVLAGAIAKLAACLAMIGLWLFTVLAH
jgi:uncharacterized protein YqgC (DUF456 family)